MPYSWLPAFPQRRWVKWNEVTCFPQVTSQYWTPVITISKAPPATLNMLILKNFSHVLECYLQLVSEAHCWFHWLQETEHPRRGLPSLTLHPILKVSQQVHLRSILDVSHCLFQVVCLDNVTLLPFCCVSSLSLHFRQRFLIYARCTFHKPVT